MILFVASLSLGFSLHMPVVYPLYTFFVPIFSLFFFALAFRGLLYMPYMLCVAFSTPFIFSTSIFFADLLINQGIQLLWVTRPSHLRGQKTLFVLLGLD